MQQKVVVVGAGLCGTLLALRLAQRGFQVEVYERRADMRKTNMSAGRSINLALSDRGMRGLRLAGLESDILPLIIPMLGRKIYPREGNAQFMPYSGRDDEWINSVSRGGLNVLLLDKAEGTGKIAFYFETECLDVDFAHKSMRVRSAQTKEVRVVDADVFFGTDGAGSAIRQTMLSESARLRFNFSLQYLTTGYKELEIPAGQGRTFQLDKNALHIWPRHGFMIIALPNLDGSFTVTLFLQIAGNPGFESLRSDTEIRHFFTEYFPDLTELMPDVLADFRANPTSSLGTVKCYPWQVNGTFLLLGDAAHAIVPFYGQGMNASFEDVVVLDGLIDKFGPAWAKVFDEFQTVRKVDADAIADLAVENENEMRDATADPVFQLKRKIELQLEQNYPDYFSKYSLVTFREDITYHDAMVKGRKQDDILMAYARAAQSMENVDLKDVLQRLKALQ